MIGWLYRRFVDICMLLFIDLEIRGWENLPDPAEGGLLIISNHFSIFEIPFIFTKLPNKPFFFATFELLDAGWMAPGIRAHSEIGRASCRERV